MTFTTYSMTSFVNSETKTPKFSRPGPSIAGAIYRKLPRRHVQGTKRNNSGLQVLPAWNGVRARLRGTLRLLVQAGFLPSRTWQHRVPGLP